MAVVCARKCVKSWTVEGRLNEPETNLKSLLADVRYAMGDQNRVSHQRGLGLPKKTAPIQKNKNNRNA